MNRDGAIVQNRRRLVPGVYYPEGSPAEFGFYRVQILICRLVVQLHHLRQSGRFTEDVPGIFGFSSRMQAIGMEVANRHRVCIRLFQIGFQIAFQAISRSLQKCIGDEITFGENLQRQKESGFCAKSCDQREC